MTNDAYACGGLNLIVPVELIPDGAMMIRYIIVSLYITS